MLALTLRRSASTNLPLFSSITPTLYLSSKYMMRSINPRCTCLYRAASVNFSCWRLLCLSHAQAALSGITDEASTDADALDLPVASEVNSSEALTGALCGCEGSIPCGLGPEMGTYFGGAFVRQASNQSCVTRSGDS